MKKGILLVTALLSLLAAVSAWAGDERRERHRRGPDRFEELLALPELNLTAEQAERIREIGEAYRRESAPLRERLIGKGRELRGLWLAPTPDRERIMALQAEVHRLRADLNGEAERALEEAKRRLTPEQRERLTRFQQDRRRHHGGMRYGGPPGVEQPEQRGGWRRGPEGGE